MFRIVFIWDFHLTKKKYGEIKSKPCATFLRNKYTVFTMGGTVALRSVNNFFQRATVLQLIQKAPIITNSKNLPNFQFSSIGENVIFSNETIYVLI